MEIMEKKTIMIISNNSLIKTISSDSNITGIIVFNDSKELREFIDSHHSLEFILIMRGNDLPGMIKNIRVYSGLSEYIQIIKEYSRKGYSISLIS